MKRRTKPDAFHHLVAQPGDRKALCGMKDPLPVCWAQAAPRHQYPHARCAACYTAAGLGHMLTGAGA